MTTEVEFAEKYQDLIRFVCPEAVSGGNLRDLKTAPGFAFSKLEDPPIYNRSKDDNNSDETILVTFRSLRPPRFSKKIEMDPNSLIHKVKRVLQKELEKDHINVQVEQIVLMLKTKTIHDGTTLESLKSKNSELTLNVLISKVKDHDEVSELKSEPKSEPKSESRSVTGSGTKLESPQTLQKLSNDAWGKIYAILKDEIEDQKTRNEYYRKLREVE
ncbi:hypothetical protein FOA43_000866 [Brettanomyces nanus]|uniref:Ubiquitin-like domain-containing protein n=1 Tax=Eeniella nana TaxID=13502 RepID=A0A875S2I1_EENNA|nr:uncharacterized protein FOA43_000866 [Brettanomyces nanus]QPG73554.1 hypothetical protein FOA43_000866 [Brettanomyces nanus]